MSKNSLKRSLENCFDFDLESGLLSDGEDKSKTFAKNSKRPKRNLNSKRNYLPQDGDSEDEGDFSWINMTEFLDKLQNEFDATNAIEKDYIEKFIRSTLDIYETRFGEMIEKQEKEIENFKIEFANDVGSELKEWEKDLNTIKQEEEKLIRIMQNLRTVYNAAEVNEKKMKKLGKLHEEFIQKYYKLSKKHKSEASIVKENIHKEVNALKVKFLADFEKDMNKVKKTAQQKIGL